MKLQCHALCFASLSWPGSALMHSRAFALLGHHLAVATRFSCRRERLPTLSTAMKALATQHSGVCTWKIIVLQQYEVLLLLCNLSYCDVPFYNHFAVHPHLNCHRRLLYKLQQYSQQEHRLVQTRADFYSKTRSVQRVDLWYFFNNSAVQLSVATVSGPRLP